MIHRARNLLAKVSPPDQAEVKIDYWVIFDDIAADPGEPAVAEARHRAAAVETEWASTYPSAVACLTGDLDILTVYCASHSLQTQPTSLSASAGASHMPL